MVSLSWKKVIISLVVLSALAAGFVSCGGGGSSSPPPPDPAAFPTATDTYEGGAGDDTDATASTITVGTPQVRTLFPDGDIDYVEVNLIGSTDYEISANNLSPQTDTIMYIYDSGMNEITYPPENQDFNDDYVSYDSRVRFTPPADGTYYIKVMTWYHAIYTDPIGVAAYTLSVHIYHDGDGDDWSDYYDCNDGDINIYPFAVDTPGDGIDQDCSGTDSLVGTDPDSYEDDDDNTQAKPMAVAGGDPWEIIFRNDMYSANSRTIYDASVSDVDWFSITVPAYSAMEVLEVQNEVTGTNNLKATLYDSNGSTIGTPANSWPYFFIENTTSAAKTYYVAFEAENGTGTGFYVPYAVSFGTDMDGDTYYSQDWDDARDCNDNNAAINPGATETSGDGVDSNCNGDDNT